MCIPGLGALGGIVSAVGSIYSGMAQAAAYKAQAQAKRAEAKALAAQGSYESARQGEKNMRITGQQVTAMASSGFALAGTPLDVIADTRTEGEMDVAAIRYGAQSRSNIAEYEAKVADMNAGIAKTGGIIGAIAPVIGSFTGMKTSFA